MANGYCRCGEEIYNDDYVFNGEALCKSCYEHITSAQGVIDFIKAYPELFIDFLEETAHISEEPKMIEMLFDYRKWHEEEFNKWAVS